jgi:hypothetical protein
MGKTKKKATRTSADYTPTDRQRGAAFGELGEKAFHGIEPGGAGQRKVERPARVPSQPSSDLGMLVCGA